MNATYSPEDNKLGHGAFLGGTMQDTTTTITKADLNERNEYSASADLSVVGHLRFAANLGRVRILGALSATLSITAEAGSGIEAGEGIEAGSGIEAG